MTQPAKRCHRVMLGRQSVHEAGRVASGFIGADFDIEQDFSRGLPEDKH